MVFSAVSAGALGKKFTKNIATFGILNSLYTDLKYIKKI